jgi:hypothetical protein
MSSSRYTSVRSVKKITMQQQAASSLLFLLVFGIKLLGRFQRGDASDGSIPSSSKKEELAIAYSLESPSRDVDMNLLDRFRWGIGPGRAIPVAPGMAGSQD